MPNPSSIASGSVRLTKSSLRAIAAIRASLCFWPNITPESYRTFSD